MCQSVYICADEVISTQILFFLFQVFIAVLLILAQFYVLMFSRLLCDVGVCRRNACIGADFLSY